MAWQKFAINQIFINVVDLYDAGTDYLFRQRNV